MLDECLSSVRKMLPRSAPRSMVVASLRLPSSCGGDSRGSPIMGKRRNVPRQSWVDTADPAAALACLAALAAKAHVNG